MAVLCIILSHVTNILSCPALISTAIPISWTDDHALWKSFIHPQKSFFLLFEPASMKIQGLLRLSFGLPALVVNDKATSTCRCLYGQVCWPNEKEFVALATQLSQPLLHPSPPELACYPPSAPSGDCSAVITNYKNGTWRSDQPGSMQNTNFETFIFHNDTISACYLNTTLGTPCGQGSVPPLGVDARSAADIQVAVNFAKRHNLKLAVKNTGHDFLGRSTARGGFLIWTHNMKERLYNSTFVPDGAPVTSRNTFNGDLTFLFEFPVADDTPISCHLWSWRSMA